MYFLFRFHHVMPSKYWNMSMGDKRISKAFMYRELDDRKKDMQGGDS